MSQKFQIKMRRCEAEALHTCIMNLLLKSYEADDDKLLMCNLYEVDRICQKKLLDIKKQYSLTLTPAQAFALRILSTDYENDITSYLGNKLHQIANEVHKQYN